MADATVTVKLAPGEYRLLVAQLTAAADHDREFANSKAAATASKDARRDLFADRREAREREAQTRYLLERL